MTEKTQYPRAKDISLPERLKLVAKFTNMGFSVNRIATELDYDPRTARKDVAAIIDRHREFDDLDNYIKDTTARLGDQLNSLNTQKAILWKQLDWASAWVPSWIEFPDGSKVQQRDEEGEPMYGPRKPGMVGQLIGQIQSLDKQIGEILGLYSRNVDITVTLQKTEQVQILMLEVIKDADPEIYKLIIRRIKAVVEASKEEKAALMSSAGAKNVNEIVEGEYEEAYSHA